jgi:hypothetical protein
MIQVSGYRLQVTAKALRQPVARFVRIAFYCLLYPVTCALLAGCVSRPPPPDWKLNAHGLLESYAKHYLNGETLLAERHFERARAEVARTGRLDLAARAELARCAIRTAALETGPCQGYTALAAHADAEDRAYARFLAGNWQGLEVSTLPPQYRALVKAQDEASLARSLEAIGDPVSRAIAAGVLLLAGRAAPEVIAAAIRTASDQGWRRALLAWLEVQLRRAEAAGDAAALALIRQRMDLVQSSLPEKR